MKWGHFLPGTERIKEKKYNDTNAGFTIIELSVVLVVGAVIMVAAGLMFQDYLLMLRSAYTQFRMTAIDNSIQTFFQNNGYYPCPSSLTAAPNTANFGASPGSPCGGAGTFTLAGAGNSNDNVFLGAVPVRTLNLSNDYEADAWNNKIVYAVTAKMTSLTTFNPAAGSIDIIDSIGNSVLSFVGKGEYVLISAGRDGVGAYSLEGGQGKPCATATLEGMNCAWTQPAILPSVNAARFRKTTITGENVGNKTYDDYVLFRTSPNQGVVPPGTIMIYNGNCSSLTSGWASLGSGGGATGLTSITPPLNYCEKN